MEVWYPYSNQEEKAALLAAHGDLTLLRDGMVGSQKLLVFEDGQEAPWDFADRVQKAFALEVLEQVNVLRTRAGLAAITVDQLKAAVKSRL